MATQFGTFIPRNSPAEAARSEQRFFVRFALALVALILFGFAQWSARGMVDVGAVPLRVHLHGGLMVAWLGLFAAQALLAQNGSRELHRKLGLASIAVLCAIVLTGIYTGIGAVQMGRVPPFFSDAHFLALTSVETLVFAGLVGWGIALRRNAAWHRRLILGSAIVLLEPSLGRMLPMPVLGHWAGFTQMCIQLGFVLLIAQRDMRRQGTVHSATLAVALAVIGTHGAITLLSAYPPFVTMTASVAGGA